MDPKVLRQIKDIQSRAEWLANGKVTLAEIEEFNQYNEELKKYLLNNLTDPELVERVTRIPQILEKSDSKSVSRNFLILFLIIFAPSLVSFFEDRQRIEHAKENIREARGNYASIEFLTKAYQ